MPKQHGAWFMLSLPVIVGLILHGRTAPLTWYLLPLSACWVLGYLAFNAVTVWLKTAAKRRRAQLPPVLAYGSASLLFGLLAVAMAGPRLLGWVVPFSVLIVPALWLAALRKERTALSGGLTTAAASVMVVVVQFVSPLDFLAAWGTEPARLATLFSGLTFGYLFGTVFHVKGLIRERGKPGWFLASVGWHLAATVTSAVLTVLGQASWAWSVFFALATVRAWALPRINEQRRVKPLTIGLVEIALTTLFIVLVAVA